MSICIYCRQPLPVSVPPEHVIPQSFGKFQDNLTLHCVCSQCNGFFGSNLEWALRGNSVEGVLRLQHGLGTGTLGHMGTAVFRVADPGPWKGARFKIKANGRTTPETIPLPQLGARKSPNDDWKWYGLKEITPALAQEYPKGSNSELQIIGASKREQDGVLKRLKAAGVDFHPKGQMAPPIDSNGTVGANVEAVFTEQISRCIAKLAFNYLAYLRGPEFVLSSEFDVVRAYIRNGQKAPLTVVRPYRNPLLMEERYGDKATDGHILRLDWSQDKRSIVAQVSLFNSLRYTVVLCNSYHGLWLPDLAQGHHFDIRARRIDQLHVTKLHLP